jgi:hypothetical protein
MEVYHRTSAVKADSLVTLESVTTTGLMMNQKSITKTGSLVTQIDSKN